MIAVASVGPPGDLPRYKKTPMTGGLFKFMVVGGGLEPSARGFSEYYLFAICFQVIASGSCDKIIF